MSGRDEMFDSILLRRDDVTPSQWPKLSCSQAHQTALENSDLRLDANREILFQGNGQLTASSDMLFLTGGSSPEKLRILTNGNVGIGISAPTEKLEVAGKIKAIELEASGTVKATAFQGDGSALTGKVNTTGDTITGSLTIQNTLTVSGNIGIGTTSPSYKLAIAAGDINIDDGRALRQAGRWVIGGNSNVLSIGSSNAPDGRDISFDPGFSGALTVKKDTGNVGIGTTNPTYKLEVVGDVKASSIHSKPKLFSFKVEGDFDKFYPIVFYDDWGDGPTELEINRPGTHTDSTWRGALNSRFIFHSSAWGNGANFCRAEIYNSGNQFIAGYENYYFTGRFVIWLRGGGTTYFWRANQFVLLGDYSAKEKIMKVNNDDSTAVKYLVKTNIEPYVLSYGISFDQNFVVQGNVGIGIANPAYKLDVAGAAHASSFPTSSDIRLKKDVTQLTNVLEKLEKIRGVCFEWNELYESLGCSTGHREIGVTAQEVEAVFPELVTTWSDEGYKAVDYGRLTGVLIEAAKELKAENEALKQRLEALERAIEKK